MMQTPDDDELMRALQGEPSFDEAFEAATAPDSQDMGSDSSAVAASLGQQLQGEYERRKGQRYQIELRWLRDIRQYNALYEPDFESALKERKFASKVFVPLTRRICNIVEARLGDLLFPTDDRNFAVTASPNPELGDASALLGQIEPQTQLNAGGAPVSAGDMKQAIAGVIDEAKRSAMSMQRVIDDQLAESDWPTQARRVMHDAIKIGTGVAKGPFVLSKTKRKWTMRDGVSQLEVENQFKAAIKRVDPWNFYPQLGASCIEDSESFFEKHPMNKLEFMQLAEQPGFDREAIIRVLESGSEQVRDANTDEQRESSGTVGVDDSRFNVIEYNGPVDAEDLIACGCDIPEDPLLVYSAVVWFSEGTGEVIKAILNPLDTGAVMYSAFNWQPDSASIFGYGLPHEIRDIQESANSSFRGAHDNMGLSVGPQMVVNSKKIQPMNGSWGIEPNKVWDLTDASVPVNNVFGFFQIDSRVSELMALFNMAKQLAEEIGGPMMAMQGTEAPNYTQTATGMSIAYNAANVWMRRAVKLWDDQVTIPRVRAFVDWNMQYNPDPDIKGDWNVVARGTSALLEAEGQVQRIQLLAQASAAAGVPVRKMINQLRQMAVAMRLDPDELLPSDEEAQQMEAAQAQQQPPPDPEMERLRVREAEIANQQQERQFRADSQAQQNQLRMAELASRENLSVEQLRMKYGLEMQQMDREHALRAAELDRKTQMFNAELVTKARQGSGI